MNGWMVGCGIYIVVQQSVIQKAVAVLLFPPRSASTRKRRGFVKLESPVGMWQFLHAIQSRCIYIIQLQTRGDTAENNPKWRVKKKSVAVQGISRKRLVVRGKVEMLSLNVIIVDFVRNM